MTFTEWISSTGGTAVVLAALGFLSRNWIAERIKGSIKHEYDKDLEQHKANLKRDYDVQIETLKAEFAKNQFRFTHVFEQMAGAIIRMHELLVELHESTQITLSNVRSREESAIQQRKEQFAKRLEVYNYLVKNKIYLPKATADKVTAFTKKLSSNQIIYESFFDARTDEGNKHIMEVMQSMYNEVPALLDDLENDFKKLLGLV